MTPKGKWQLIKRFAWVRGWVDFILCSIDLRNQPGKRPSLLGNPGRWRRRTTSERWQRLPIMMGLLEWGGHSQYVRKYSFLPSYWMMMFCWRLSEEWCTTANRALVFIGKMSRKWPKTMLGKTDLGFTRWSWSSRHVVSIRWSSITAVDHQPMAKPQLFPASLKK